MVIAVDAPGGVLEWYGVVGSLLIWCTGVDGAGLRTAIFGGSCTEHRRYGA